MAPHFRSFTKGISRAAISAAFIALIGLPNMIAGTLPAVVTNTQTFSMDYHVKGSHDKILTIDVAIDAAYANLSVYANDVRIIDNLDIPSPGAHQLKALVTFDAPGKQALRFEGRSADIQLKAVSFQELTDLTLPRFKDISPDIGFNTETTYKYSGPSIGDVDNDGDYDFVLNNHNYIPTQLVTNNGDQPVTIKRLFEFALDFHGSSLGDYDSDGDLDIMVAMGGGNGTSPTSYCLLKNNDGTFENVSDASGITTPARGRAPRWVDWDQDGHLDLMLVNAKTPNFFGAQQLFYRNDGKGGFTPVSVPRLEKQPAERALVTDFNQDGKDDVILYFPLTFWQGNGDFTFTEVTKKWLPEDANTDESLAITDVDINNDGLFDLYLARGKTHYRLSKKSIDFNPLTGKMNIRDDGEKGATAILMNAEGPIELSHIDLVFRQHKGNYPLFLGADKTRVVFKASGFQPNQIPEEMKAAPEKIEIAPEDAAGWPATRETNGIYIGYLGDGKWRAEWTRDDSIYWNISFTLSGLTDLDYDWEPNNRNEQDILLINKGDRFEVAPESWNLPLGGNHWGVTHGDFNNDGWNDLFINRYGFVAERVSDLLLLNTGKNSFHVTTQHGASDPADPGHGDMGQAFDFDADGKVDLLSGSEEQGRWYLYQNQTEDDGNSILINVGLSPKRKIGPLSADVIITTQSGKKHVKRVGSAGEVFSQSHLDTLHFGIGTEKSVKQVEVKWRNGETLIMKNLAANQLHSTDKP